MPKGSVGCHAKGSWPVYLRKSIGRASRCIFGTDITTFQARCVFFTSGRLFLTRVADLSCFECPLAQSKLHKAHKTAGAGAGCVVFYDHRCWCNAAHRTRACARVIHACKRHREESSSLLRQRQVNSPYQAALSTECQSPLPPSSSDRRRREINITYLVHVYRSVGRPEHRCTQTTAHRTARHCCFCYYCNTSAGLCRKIPRKPNNAL
jgi:hypothetical protein